MTTVAVLAELPDDAPLADHESLSAEDATALYRASLLDVCDTVEHGEADLLVNYPESERDSNAELQSLLDDELSEPGSVRYEVQVGESYAGRVGNALTHLLESEGERTVGVVEPTAPLLRREHIGTIAMKLRSDDVVLGPTTNGGLYFAGFTDPVDFTDSYAAPAVETMTQRAVDAGLSVAYLPVLPCLDAPAGLAAAVSLIRARKAAEKIVPSRTTRCVEELGLTVEDGQVVSTRSDNS
ncbi:Uncharacterized conserved protein, glycosyltransferase A (GT-A) superfamily, DUF2064 family [Halovenus aranensis]|jgi:glycosyltransferase A (GT-A) superfamily protein (DUF2064 family)|uniref:Uncharacterized conserved protein, glycosyltransferase A (GT-A) superfamily, DUF2064 family n=1 Tax=Halovenus aranensis TaxID=890420 RepID=A0A1G8RZV2_9EURY|nr:DUF2064 domain-containing protein [Halovenus aranensis]SDJ22486.1 Uncharacterized conserved protein, glycosyltransferase A (GT-A) superfamily, DUF2064 family [Halovenus aranensis]